MEKEREIQNRRVLEFLKNFPVAAQFFRVLEEHGVELIDADQGVLVRCVAVVELVLDEAVERPELRHVATEKTEVVHQAENRADLAFARQDREERLPRGPRILECSVHQRKPPADEVGEFGVEFELADLGVVEGPDHAVGIVVEDLTGLGLDAPVAGHEPVELFDFRPRPEHGEESGRLFDRPGLHPLERRFGEEVDVPRVAVEIPHERLDLAENGFLLVVERDRDFALELEREGVYRPVIQVMHLGACPEQEIVSVFEQPALGLAQDSCLDQLGGRRQPQLELRDPQEALVIAEPADPIFDIGLLEEHGRSVFDPELGLVVEAPGDVFLLAPADALILKAFFEGVEDFALAGQEPGLEHRGLRDHVLVGFGDSLLDRACRMADFEAEVP